MAEDFALDPVLIKDAVSLMDWPLCRVLLMNDAQYPWLILVPRRPSLRDLHDLEGEDYATCLEEVARASRRLQAATGAHKMNVAALGNVVPQLHIHVIARFTVDPAWPKPVWGVRPPEPYGKAALRERVAEFRAALEGVA